MVFRITVYDVSTKKYFFFIFKMFFFDDPFDYDPLEDYFNYRYNRRRRQPQVRRNLYYDPIEDRLNQVLMEEFGLDPYYNIDIERRARQLQHQSDLES